MMLITFSGIDGSGKTTQARNAAYSLQMRGYKIHYVHMTRWTWVHAIGEYLAKNKQGIPIEEAVLITIPSQSIYHRGSNLIHRFLRQFVKMMRQFVSLIDLLRFRWVIFYQIYLWQRVVICDRYFYDLGIQALYTKMMGYSMARLYWMLTPSPTLSILLDVSPQLAAQREREHPLEYYGIKRELYLNHAYLWGSTVIQVTGVEETQQAIDHILMQIDNTAVS